MGRLAQPQHLLLNLREPLEAALHGEIAARDHHAHGRAFQGLAQLLRGALHVHGRGVVVGVVETLVHAGLQGARAAQ